ncbi:MAG TPA: hypothetical protein VML19_28390 [Verrucomicrobiae bacterium]|nr:hypothetical protein [Verrucomicrobiae bacterium]
MKRLPIILLLSGFPVLAQFASPARPAASISIDPPRLSFDIVKTLERQFDSKLASPGGKEPFEVIGPTRGLYVQGTGMIFTAELDLIIIAGANPLFRHEFTDSEKAQFHARKLEQLRVLEAAMRDMMSSSAQRLDIMPDNERIVLAVRLLYRPWENTAGLPVQILMSADRKSAIAGQIKEETTR